jgi:hypothetical protein
VELQGRIDELNEAGIGVAAISYDSVEILATFAEERGITFPLLSDQDSAVIARYGILNTVAAELEKGESDDPVLLADEKLFGGSYAVGTPYPGTFMVDADGRVTARHFEYYYRERNTTANVMLQLGIDVPPVFAIEGSTPEIAFTAYPSDSIVAAGSRFAIAIDVEPKENMHVYAPGAEENGYRVIGLTLDANPGLRFETVEYPASEIYHFKPLDEHVPVYMEPFTILQEVVVEASSNAQDRLDELEELTLTGSFNYQACDEEICYLPERVPLSFTFKIAREN